MTTVLIAVDGTEESHLAARRAKELFGDRAHYLVVAVAEPVPPVMTPAPVETVLPPDPEVVEAMAEQAEADAHEAALEDMQSVDPEILVGEGDPVGVLCATAERRNVDVIVVGSHERSWFSRFLDPPVRDRLVRSAPCSVLVVRTPKAAGEHRKH
ncbi:MAG TPA: universal stress protein [Acidimicrobiales bacterium]|jgi:nucleotide-binding universal stress UspA family protein|nr:universal stress protein [Acidimicrobiales bacterium]